MTHGLKPHAVIAGRVKELRNRRGWSGAHLAKELAKVGLPWDRSIVANFENQRRGTLDVWELLALAYVLGVSPIHLMLPVGQDDETYAHTPEYATPVGEMRDWLLGVEPLAGQHPGWFAEETSHGDR